ncbi:hypothetical protein Pryu01_00519 [Paraliobacillus ryukyuensis]|uniref:Competence protein ComGD n=1 Tax=Paraliobacillus ryukyuensis TaxID=200904 RepID=A0A366EGF0_9BACI|nr:competence type IV pilus minor pilin ComGD [Paraliobacillus ryukyuensis]RBP01408.1 competence protein ComGD [Paraliobacillus ryukyuensis]
MNKQHGFSLVELLIVLSILTIILFIGGTIHIKTYQQYQFNQWYQIFSNDILRMQQDTIISNKNLYLTINPTSNVYEIRKGGLGELIISRKIPKKWNINLYSLKIPLSFSKNGTIKKPGRFQIVIADKTREIVFPFGKGRCYVREK